MKIYLSSTLLVDGAPWRQTLSRSDTMRADRADAIHSIEARRPDVTSWIGMSSVAFSPRDEASTAPQTSIHHWCPLGSPLRSRIPRSCIGIHHHCRRPSEMSSELLGIGIGIGTLENSMSYRPTPQGPHPPLTLFYSLLSQPPRCCSRRIAFDHCDQFSWGIRRLFGYADRFGSNLDDDDGPPSCQGLCVLVPRMQGVRYTISQIGQSAPRPGFGAVWRTEQNSLRRDRVWQQ